MLSQIRNANEFHHLLEADIEVFSLLLEVSLTLPFHASIVIS